jgi:fatty acid-binding protein DegV
MKEFSMAKIAIITDSTAYLEKAYVKKHNIRVIPLNLHWDGDTYKDNVDISPDEFYDRLKVSSTLPTTSQPTYGDFQVIFKKYAPDYDGIIVALISSGISGTVDSALIAQKPFKDIPVEVIDTKTTAGGLAMVVKAIATAVEGGKSMDETTALARAIADSTCTYFVVDTLKYLHKGGRIGGASRYFGTALNIKPKKKAVNRLLELAVEKAAGKKSYVAIYHAQALKEAETMRNEIQQMLDCYEVGIYKLSPVIGTHVGEGALGISVHTVEY